MAKERTETKVRLPLRAKWSARRQYRQASKVADEARRLAQTAEAKRVVAELHRNAAQEAGDVAVQLDAAAEAAEHSAAAKAAMADRLRATAAEIEAAGREQRLGRKHIRRENEEARERKAAEQRGLREKAAKKSAAQIAAVEQEAAARLQAAIDARARTLGEADALIAERRTQVADALEAYHVAILAEAEAMAQRTIMKKAHDASVKNVQSENAAALKKARKAAEDAVKQLAREHENELKGMKANHERAENQQKHSLRPRIAKVRNAQALE